MMKKHLTALCILVCLPVLFWAQTKDYYIQLEEVSGTNTAPLRDSLVAHAYALAQSLPDAFRSQFRVYDFNFCLQQEVTYGYPDVFEKKKKAVAALSPYYLLFGRQTDTTGKCTRFWVDLQLPESGGFACFSASRREFLKINMFTLANNIYSKTPSAYTGTEMLVMDSLKHKILKIIECCAVNNAALGCANCPDEDEINSYFSSGLHGEYSGLPVFVTDSTSGFNKQLYTISNVEDYTNDILFHQESYEFNSSYFTALGTIEDLLIDSINVKVFVTKNENFCDPELFSKLENDFKDSDFSFAIHIHYFKTKGCDDSNQRCDWVLSKFFWKKK